MEAMSDDWTEGRVYFTHHPSGAIQSAIISNGKVIAQDTFQQDLCPRKWTDALCEMEETRRKSWSSDSTPGWESNVGVNEEWSAGHDIFADFMAENPQPQASTWLEPTKVAVDAMQHSPTPQDTVINAADTRALNSHQSSPSPTATISVAIISKNLREMQPAGSLGATRNLKAPFHAPVPRSPRINRFKKPDLEAKRIVKLSRFLEAIRNSPSPSLEDHNKKVNALYDGPRLPSSETNVSMMQFAGVLSQVGDVSTTMGFIYTLLSWEIFRREELHLVYREKMAGNLAAKRVNQQMADLLKRRCKAKDWASDGRRAAEMVFRAMKNVSFAVSSCALVLLGDVSSLDCMLKIAHFPVLRHRFEERFANFVHSRAPEWEARALQGYRMFDFEEFLRQRGRPPNRQHMLTPLSSQSPELNRSFPNTGDRLTSDRQCVETTLSCSLLERHWEISSIPWSLDSNHVVTY